MSTQIPQLALFAPPVGLICNLDLRTFSVIAEAHLCLAQTNCVLSLADAIELLEVGLLNALRDGCKHWFHQLRLSKHSRLENLVILT